MNMDSIICVNEDSDNTFDRWLKITIPKFRDTVMIPVTQTEYFRTREGKEAGVTVVRVNEDGSVKFSRVRQTPEAEERTDGPVIGLDWGLVSMFATSDGRRLGAHFYEYLKRMDEQLTELTKRLQTNNVKPRDSKRFRRLNHRIREYARNEIGRIINKLAEEGVSELVVERLDFRGGGMSKRMNRILSRAGRGAIRAKLSAVTEDYGVTVTEVNPAHTSRECDGCGFTHKTNRKNQAGFVCRFCGKSCNADIGGARTISSRRSRGDVFQFADKDVVLDLLDKRFHKRWGISFADVVQRQGRGCSTAPSLRK